MTNLSEPGPQLPKEPLVSDLIRVLSEGLPGSDPAPERLEVRVAGVDDVMVRVYPRDGDDFDGYALKWSDVGVFGG